MDLIYFNSISRTWMEYAGTEYGIASPFMGRVELTGAMRLGSLMVFVAHIVFPCSVLTCTVRAAVPMPWRVIVMGRSTDVAFTSFKHTLLDDPVAAEKNLSPAPDTDEVKVWSPKHDANITCV